MPTIALIFGLWCARIRDEALAAGRAEELEQEATVDRLAGFRFGLVLFNGRALDLTRFVVPDLGQTGQLGLAPPVERRRCPSSLESGGRSPPSEEHNLVHGEPKSGPERSRREHDRLGCNLEMIDLDQAEVDELLHGLAAVELAQATTPRARRRHCGHRLSRRPAPTARREDDVSVDRLFEAQFGRQRRDYGRYPGPLHQPLFGLFHQGATSWGSTGFSGSVPVWNLKLPSSNRNKREQGVDSAVLAANVKACDTTGIEPNTADSSARFDPQLARLRGDGQEREDVWQCNCFKRTFKRHGNLRL